MNHSSLKASHHSSVLPCRSPATSTWPASRIVLVNCVVVREMPRPDVAALIYATSPPLQRTIEEAMDASPDVCRVDVQEI